MPVLPTAETSNGSPLKHLCLGCSNPPGIILTSLNNFFIERITLCPFWSRYLVWLWVFLSWIKCFCPNYHTWTPRTPLTLLWHPTQNCFWLRNSFHTQRNTTVSPGSWNPLLLQFLPPLWSNCPDRTMKDTLTTPRRWLQPVEFGADFPEVDKCFEIVSNKCFPHSKDTQVQESRNEKGNDSIYYHTKWPTKKISLPVPWP